MRTDFGNTPREPDRRQLDIVYLEMKPDIFGKWCLVLMKNESMNVFFYRII